MPQTEINDCPSDGLPWTVGWYLDQKDAQVFSPYPSKPPYLSGREDIGLPCQTAIPGAIGLKHKLVGNPEYLQVSLIKSSDAEIDEQALIAHAEVWRRALITHYAKTDYYDHIADALKMIFGSMFNDDREDVFTNQRDLFFLAFYPPQSIMPFFWENVTRHSNVSPLVRIKVYRDNVPHPAKTMVAVDVISLLQAAEVSGKTFIETVRDIRNAMDEFRFHLRAMRRDTHDVFTQSFIPATEERPSGIALRFSPQWPSIAPSIYEKDIRTPEAMIRLMNLNMLSPLLVRYQDDDLLCELTSIIGLVSDVTAWSLVHGFSAKNLTIDPNGVSCFSRSLILDWFSGAKSSIRPDREFQIPARTNIPPCLYDSIKDVIDAWDDLEARVTSRFPGETAASKIRSMITDSEIPETIRLEYQNSPIPSDREGLELLLDAITAIAPVEVMRHQPEIVGMPGDASLHLWSENEIALTTLMSSLFETLTDRHYRQADTYSNPTYLLTNLTEIIFHRIPFSFTKEWVDFLKVHTLTRAIISRQASPKTDYSLWRPLGYELFEHIARLTHALVETGALADRRKTLVENISYFSEPKNLPELFKMLRMRNLENEAQRDCILFINGLSVSDELRRFDIEGEFDEQTLREYNCCLMQLQLPFKTLISMGY